MATIKFRPGLHRLIDSVLSQAIGQQVQVTELITDLQEKGRAKISLYYYPGQETIGFCLSMGSSTIRTLPQEQQGHIVRFITTTTHLTASPGTLGLFLYVDGDGAVIPLELEYLQIPGYAKTNYYVLLKDFIGLEKGTLIPQGRDGSALVKVGKSTYDISQNRSVVKKINHEEYEKNHKGSKVYKYNGSTNK